MSLAIVALTPGGAALARRLQQARPTARVYLPATLAAEADQQAFAAPLAEVLPELFASHDGLICIMATGIVVRLLAPHLRGKQHDPAVVVLDEAGAFAISLLSGHLGGANRLARELAAALGGQAVITTATDVNRLPAWDEVAHRAGLVIEPLNVVKTFNRLLLEGQPIALIDPQLRIAPQFAAVPGVLRFATFLEADTAGIAARVYVTHRRVEPGDGPLLQLRPRDLVLGIGCNRGTPVEEIAAAVDAVLERFQLAGASVGALATIEAKRDEPGLQTYAAQLGLPLRCFAAEQLNAVAVPSAPSPHALQAVGAQGVCEPAALLAAAPGRLLVRKQKQGNVTVAVAELLGAPSTNSPAAD